MDTLKTPVALTGFRHIFKKMTPTLFMACFITALLNMVFGYDTTSFGGVQNIPSFVRQFGDKTGPNKYVLTASRASFMSSVAFAGKLTGTLVRILHTPACCHRWLIGYRQVHSQLSILATAELFGLLA